MFFDLAADGSFNVAGVFDLRADFLHVSIFFRYVHSKRLRLRVAQTKAYQMSCCLVFQIHVAMNSQIIVDLAESARFSWRVALAENHWPR